MRIIRVKLSNEVRELLAEYAHQYLVSDSGLIEDIYALVRLRGNGLPSFERLDLLSEAFAKSNKLPIFHVKLLMRKRRQCLVQIAQLPYFMTLSRGDNPFEAVDHLLFKFRTLYYKMRQAQCLTCNLYSRCDFGKQYGGITRDITLMIDPDFSKKVHPECPLLPQIDLLNQLYEAASHLSQIAQPQQGGFFTKLLSIFGKKYLSQALTSFLGSLQSSLDRESKLLEEAVSLTEDNAESDLDVEEAEEEFGLTSGRGAGKETVYDTHNVGGSLIQLTDAYIEELRTAHLQIWELARNFERLLDVFKKDEFKPTRVTSQDRITAQIKNLGEIAQLKPSQYALPEAIFEGKMIRKALIKKQHQKPETKKQLLYILCDTSGSMLGWTSSKARRFFYTRAVLAASFIIALVRRVRDDGGMLFFRFYSGAPASLISARVKSDFDDLEKVIEANSFDGGSTNILAALRAAVTDISSAQDEISRSEILLITDCEDFLDPGDVTKLLGNIKLDVLDVAGHSQMMACAEALKAVAQSYYKVDEQAVDLNKIVNLVGHK
jgi:uncharacterized protein with von Willebrand factor type A (vWA) domain